MAGADVLLVFDVEVDDLEEQLARFHDELADLAQCGFVENYKTRVLISMLGFPLSYWGKKQDF